MHCHMHIQGPKFAFQGSGAVAQTDLKILAFKVKETKFKYVRCSLSTTKG